MLARDAEDPDGEREHEVKKLLGWAITASLLAAVVVTVMSLLQTPTYEASAVLLVGQKEQSYGKIHPIPNPIADAAPAPEQQLAHTMVVAIKSPPVADEVIQGRGLQMGTQELLDNLTVEQIEDTSFLLLSYRDTDRQRAKDVVNDVSDTSIRRISAANVSTNDTTVTVYKRAAVPGAPISPDPLRNGLLALGLGLMLGTGLAFLLEYLDDRWRSPEEVERFSGVPAFGVIPEFALAKNGRRRGR
jgi:capsular polysaccharide biosynthesis protein